MRILRPAGHLLFGGAIFVGCRATPPPLVSTPDHRPTIASGASWVLVDIPHSKGSQAVLEGSASLVADCRYELVEGPAARWSLSHGPLGTPTVSTRLPFLDDCRFVSIAAFETHLMMSCEPAADAKTLRLHVTNVDGTHPHALDPLCGEGRWNRLWPASLDGAVVVEGGCLDGAEDSFGSMPPLLRTLDGALHPVDDRTAPNALAPNVFALRWTPRGDLYVLCDDGGGEIFLLASTDGGVTFRHHALPPITREGVTFEPRLDHVGTLRVDDDGRVVVIIREIERNLWLRYDSRDYGNTLPGTVLAIEAESIDLAGARGLAYSEQGDAWETNDAGVTWHAVAPPPAHPDAKNDFERRVSCAAGGCLVDRWLARVGWSLPPPLGD